MSDWYIKEGKREHGPFSSKAIKRMARSGDLSESDAIRRADQVQWSVAGKIRGLFDSSTSESSKSRPNSASKTSRSRKVKGKTKDRYFLAAGLLQFYVFLAVLSGVGWVYIVQTNFDFEVGSQSDRFFLSMGGALVSILLAALIEFIALGLLRFKRWSVIGAQAVFTFSFVGIITLPFAVAGLWALFRIQYDDDCKDQEKKVRGA